MLFLDLAIFLKKGIWFLVSGGARAARRFWFQGRETVSETRGGFAKGKCGVWGLSDFENVFECSE